MKLRVTAPFRDIDNFAIRHEVGDVVEVTNPDRISRLVGCGLCQYVKEEPVLEPETADLPVLPEQSGQPAPSALSKPKPRRRK